MPNTKFVTANIILPAFMGIVMNNLGIMGCNYSGYILKYAPCELVNFLVVVIITAIILDLIVYVVWPMILVSRIKIKNSNKGFSEIIPPPVKGFHYYGMLDVEIPKGWVITDCFATLEKSVMIYLEDKTLLDPKFSTWFADKTKPEYKILRWKSRFSNPQDCKLIIGENSNTESILVGKISAGKISDGRNPEIDFSAFSFPFCGDHPTMIHINKMGLRIISLEFHWKRNGVRMISKKFNGYLYSEHTGSSYKIFVRSGDYRKDSDIPKPILKEINEVKNDAQEKPKDTKKPRKKATIRAKKRSLH